MKATFFLLLILIASSFRNAPQVYRADASASQLTWTGYAEVGTWAPSGTLRLAQGRIEADGLTLRAARFEFDMRTIAHDNEQLQGHLRGADFFDAERHPIAVFELREVSGATARGQLTLKGIGKPVQFPVQVSRMVNGQLRVAGRATVDRTQFGVTFNSANFFQNLGDHAIRNDFQLDFVVVASPVQAAAKPRPAAVGKFPKGR
ncbi:YceI family protein [Hymenobacter koreensis]|uniref:Lipid/polyisoprenoid-binding YceI-like domain-containing protein n=1 Tax=Hymenobacter koreensis TaxID=1084523 RepID=A0ABP8IUY0_9BACT